MGSSLLRRRIPSCRTILAGAAASVPSTALALDDRAIAQQPVCLSRLRYDAPGAATRHRQCCCTGAGRRCPLRHIVGLFKLCASALRSGCCASSSAWRFSRPRRGTPKGRARGGPRRSAATAESLLNHAVILLSPSRPCLSLSLLLAARCSSVHATGHAHTYIK